MLKKKCKQKKKKKEIVKTLLREVILTNKLSMVAGRAEINLSNEDCLKLVTMATCPGMELALRIKKIEE